MICLAMVFNKMTGFYGFLALLTGLKLSATQMSMYIYSVAALVLLALLMPHIRKQSPFQNLALAWFYLLDFIINSIYTLVFAVTWFLTISAHQPDKAGDVGGAPGHGMINDTAGFTNPEIPTVSVVEVVATPAAGIAGGQDAVAYGVAASAAAVSGDPSVSHGLGLAESMPSIIIVVLLTILRIYFVLIVMAYARQVLRNYMADASSARTHLHMDGASDAESVDPFGPTTPNGQGWKGKLGRIMTSIGKGYWLGNQGETDWVRSTSRRFKTQKADTRGTSERERRARSGTGPPVPTINLPKVASNNAPK